MVASNDDAGVAVGGVVFFVVVVVVVVVVDARVFEAGAEADDEFISPVLRFLFGGRWEGLWRVYFVVMRVCLVVVLLVCLIVVTVSLSLSAMLFLFSSSFLSFTAEA